MGDGPLLRVEQEARSPQHPEEHRPDPRQRSRTRRALLCCLVGLALLAVLAGAGVWSLQNKLAGNVEHFGNPFVALPDRPPVAAGAKEPDPATGQSALNLLVLGSDSRISAGNPEQWEAGAQRTDAIMLVHLPADAKAAYVMSIPRDAWVDVPGHGSAKINAAFSYGGPSLMIRTVEQLTDVRIDHFAVADFASFTALTDELGGVQITLKEPLYSGDRLLAPAGQQLLDGDEALVYVRQRKGLAGGDFDRVQRQQAWIRAIFARVRNEQTLQNPVESVPFLDAVTSSIAADDGLSKDVLRDLVDRAKDLGSSDVTFLTVPVTGTGRSPDGVQSIVELDRPDLAALMRAVAEDEVRAYLDEHEDDLDVLPPVAP